MDSAKLQAEIKRIFIDSFGETPLAERLTDIMTQATALSKYKDIASLKDKGGDLLCSVIQLSNECDWHVPDLIKNTLLKIDRRSVQYKTLGRKFKVAIYGGAFDPITIGHMQVAKFLLNSGHFDQVWFMPAYKHMYGKEMTHWLERTRMIYLANDDKRIQIFNYEIDNKLSGETYKTTKHLLSDISITDVYDLSFVMGMDNANTFNKWVNYQELEKIAKFVIVSRKGVERDDTVDWYLKQPHIYLKDNNGEISDTSSTTAKKFIHEHDEEGLLTQLDKRVIAYIKENNLYDSNISNDN